MPEPSASPTPAAAWRAGAAASPLAVFLASLDAGGAERGMLNLASALAADGWPVELVLARAAGALLSQVPAAVPVVDLRARRTAAALPGLARYLDARRPAGLIATVTHVNLVALVACWLAGSPPRVVVVEQSTPALAERSPLRRDRWALRALGWLYPRADAVVAVSEATARGLGRLAPGLAGRVRVVPNLVVTPELWHRARAPLEHPWLRSGEPPVVLAVGRLAVEKDWPTLLDAFALLRRRRPARLLVLGEGPARRALTARVAALGLGAEVALPGFDANPYRYMARAAVVALASQVEGLPAVLVEALALGTPVVSTDCGSGPREILDDGRFGRLVPVGDPHALAGALEATLDAPRPVAPAAAWQRYTAGAIVPRYLELLGVPAAEVARR